MCRTSSPAIVCITAKMVELRTRQPVQPYEKLKVATFPFFLENILVIALFTVMFTVACVWAALPVGMGIRSVTFWFICITLFFNYVFVIVDYTSRGLQRVPKLSGELVFPTHDSRLYTIAVLTICYLAFVFGGLDSDSQSIRMAISFFTYPLMFSLLIVHQSFTTLLNPLALLRTLYIFSTSVDSLIFYSWQLLTGVILFLEITYFGEIAFAHIFWQVPLTLTLLFILFRSLGVALNTQGPKFGLPVLGNEETHQQALAVEARIQLDDFILKLYRWVRVHEYDKAFVLIEAFWTEQGHDRDADLFHRLSQWDDKRLASMLGAHFAERLIQEGDTPRALKVFRESYDMRPTKFSFSSGTMVMLFIDAAKDVASCERLFDYLQRFNEDFPNHPMTATLMLKLATLAIDQFNRPKVAREALSKAKATDPGCAESPEFRRLLAAIAA